MARIYVASYLYIPMEIKAMPLDIRDETVADLARQTKEATGARTVTDAVRAALEKALQEAKATSPKRKEQLFAEAIALADAMGPSDHSFDMKKFRDELYGE